MRSALALALLGAMACRPSLPSALVRGHPHIVLERPKAVVEARSATVAPSWLDGAGADGVVVGQATGASLEEARAAAQKDLRRSAAQRIEVDVESEFSAEESYQETDGEVSEASRVHQASRAHAEELELPSDAEYWERVRLGGALSFRVALRGTLGAEEMALARVLRQLSRARADGRCPMLVLPPLGPAGVELHEALVRALRAVPRLGVADAELSRQLRREAVPLLARGVERVVALELEAGALSGKIYSPGQEASFRVEGGDLFALEEEAARAVERSAGACGARGRRAQR